MSAFKQKLARLGAIAGVVASATAMMLAVGGVSASSAAAACTSTIEGQGSSLQKVAQLEIWTPGFESEVCSTGTFAKPKYTSTSSGKGLAAWGFNGSGTFERTWSYIGTDDGPNATQITSARAAASKTSAADVVVVPVAQTAISIMVHPPAECTITSITNANLEKAFDGAATTWAGIGASGKGCTSSLTRVVRQEGSGTTYQFKNYLALVNKLVHGGTEAATCTGQAKWSELEEIGKEKEEPNINWPECGTIALTRAAGGGALAEKVAATVGTIGYASLPDAKAKSATTISVQNNGINGTPIYAAPNNGEEEAKCASAEYTVPSAGLSTGSGLDVDWSKVFGGNPSIGGTTYAICTLTYDLGWHSYVNAGFGSTTGGFVKRYYEYELSHKLGTGTKKHWYSNLPSKVGESEVHNVQAAAEFAVTKVE